MGYDESRESYERAHAQHRSLHGPHGTRDAARNFGASTDPAATSQPGGVQEMRALEDESAHDFGLRLAEALRRHEKLAMFGARVLEILRERNWYGRPSSQEETYDQFQALTAWKIDKAARSLGLLPGEAKEGGS